MRWFITNRRTRRAPLRDGFTLAEMVVVIVVTAIVAATAAPALVSLDRTRSAIATRQCLRDLTFARQRAIATGVPSWVVFDVNAETWTVMAEDPAIPWRAGAATLNDAGTGRPFVQQLGGGEFPSVQILAVDIDDDIDIGFDWLGRPLDAGASELVSVGIITFTHSCSISIEPATGHLSCTTP